jgi:hypothetical protein
MSEEAKGLIKSITGMLLPLPSILDYGRIDCW